MIPSKRLHIHLVSFILAVFVLVLPGSAQTQPTPAARDGQHDFDPLLGSWKYHLKRRMNPLTGSNTWVEFDGTGVCRKVWDGSQLDTIDVDGPTGHIEGLTLRLYNPQSHQWRLYWANSKIGILDPPNRRIQGWTR